MRAQHRALRAAVARIQAADETSLERALSDFARQLTEHIRFEERDLFPAVEECLDAAAAHELGLRLVARREAAGRSSPREQAAVTGTLLELD
jgi:hemerythrin superfamily protein